MINHGRTLTSVAVAAYLLCFGVLAGMAVDRMLYDRHREEVLARYDQAVAQWQELRMTWEREAASRATRSASPVDSEPRAAGP
ncbi:MAG TPA: hypothetical protein VIA61_15600 [Methylomirabilota bacterium]|jgi:hypothetical protein